MSEQQWTEDAAKHLVGRTIESVRYLTPSLADELDWSMRPLIIRLDNGTVIYPTSDDEGNNGGALHTTIKGLEIIPVL